MKYDYTLEELLERYPELSGIREQIALACDVLTNAFLSGRKLLLCGNGGSAADSEHISGELLKGFLSRRHLSEETVKAMRHRFPDFTEEDAKNLQYGLPAVPLTSLQALNTAFSNDVNPEYQFAQGVMALGNPGDVLLAISTSGNSKNCVAAAKTAKAKGLRVISLTGAQGGKLKTLADVPLTAPETETFKVQELHVALYHYICAECEKKIFG